MKKVKGHEKVLKRDVFSFVLYEMPYRIRRSIMKCLKHHGKNNMSDEILAG